MDLMRIEEPDDEIRICEQVRREWAAGSDRNHRDNREGSSYFRRIASSALERSECWNGYPLVTSLLGSTR